MNFGTLKELLELLPKIFSYCKAHRIVNLVKMGVMLMIFYMCFMEFYLKNRYFQDAKRTNIISQKIGDIVKECGTNSFVSWSTIEDTRASLSKKKLTFNDVVGCIGKNKDHCPVSVRYSNPAYLKDYSLGYDDYDFLNNRDSGVIVRCEITNGDPNCPDPQNLGDYYTPNVLKEIVKSTNLELSEISYVMVKDWKRNLVYIFTLSFAKNSINTCSINGGNLLLDNLASTAMQNL
ncbi:MAG: hypothetical protein ACRC6O_13245 [Flavobacterium sp.]